MIQVYKKNNLFIIEDTVRDMIYPNLTRRESKELLKFFGRDADRVKYAITDFENFKYVNLDDKEKQLAITEKALELACETIKEICGKPLWIGGNVPTPKTKDSEYFIIIAKEMLENEERR